MNSTDKHYLDLKLDLNNLLLYTIRKRLLKAITFAIPQMGGTLLDLGCGNMPYKKIILERNPDVTEYIGLDLERSTYYDHVVPDITWDGEKIPLPDSSIDTIVATEVLEHVFMPDLLLNESHRVLRKGGLLFITVPFIWHLHETPYDAYRYTPFSLEKLLVNSGYNNIKIHALGGWNASLSQMLGLWITFKPLKRIHKSILLRVFKMLIYYLDKTDDAPDSFNNNDKSMISGLYAFARK